MIADCRGNWLAVWIMRDIAGGTLGTDWDILTARSTDIGVVQSAPAALNTNADSDDLRDLSPRVTTDGRGNCVAYWVELFGNQYRAGPHVLVAHSADNGTPRTDPTTLARV